MHINIWLSGDDAQRVEAQLERVRAKCPGIDISQAQVAKLLITRGLDVIEAESVAKVPAPRAARRGSR